MTLLDLKGEIALCPYLTFLNSSRMTVYNR
nr:MAG TPA: hypothetical protein [Caudoviricetes sp.]